MSNTWELSITKKENETAFLIFDKQGYLVGKAYSEANARLIEKAPELLAALKSACNQIEELSESETHTESYRNLIRLTEGGQL